MTHDEREQLASLLVQHSIKRGDFTLASGQKTDTYCDVKKTSLRSDGAYLIGRGLLELVGDADAVGGLTLGADPLVTAVSLTAALANRACPAIIVRKKAKGHGTAQAVECPGGLAEGARVVALDDVVTTAGSTLQAIEALRAAGFIVEDAACVVDREAGGRERLAEHGVTLHSLFTLRDLAE